MASASWRQSARSRSRARDGAAATARSSSSVGSSGRGGSLAAPARVRRLLPAGAARPRTRRSDGHVSRRSRSPCRPRRLPRERSRAAPTPLDAATAPDVEVDQLPGREQPRVLDAVGGRDRLPVAPCPAAAASPCTRRAGRRLARAAACPASTRRPRRARRRARRVAEGELVIFCCESETSMLARSGRPRARRTRGSPRASPSCPSNWNEPQMKRTAGGTNLSFLPCSGLRRDEVGDLLRQLAHVVDRRRARRLRRSTSNQSCSASFVVPGADELPRRRCRAGRRAPDGCCELVGEADLQRLGVELHRRPACPA